MWIVIEKFSNMIGQVVVFYDKDNAIDFVIKLCKDNNVEFSGSVSGDDDYTVYIIEPEIGDDEE